MTQTTKTKRVRGYQIHVFRGAQFQPASFTTSLMWREKVPLTEWQQVISDPATQIETPTAIIVEAETIVATVHEEEKRAGGRPRKHKERLQIKVSSNVAAYLRSLKGGDDGYSGYLESLIQSDPRFIAFLEQAAKASPLSCV